MSVLTKLGNIDKRIVYVCILIVGCYFSVFSIGLPVPTKPWVIDFYQTINNLQPGDLILFQASITPSTLSPTRKLAAFTFWVGVIPKIIKKTIIENFVILFSLSFMSNHHLIVFTLISRL